MQYLNGGVLLTVCDWNARYRRDIVETGTTKGAYNGKRETYSFISSRTSSFRVSARNVKRAVSAIEM